MRIVRASERVSERACVCVHMKRQPEQQIITKSNRKTNINRSCCFPFCYVKRTDNKCYFIWSFPRCVVVVVVVVVAAVAAAVAATATAAATSSAMQCE